MRLGMYSVAAALALSAMSVTAQASSSSTGSIGALQGAIPENTGASASIVRRASGTWRYETMKDRRRRGEEHFRLLVHPGQSLTLLMWYDLFPRDAQFTVVLQRSASFRPLEAFVSYRNGGQFNGGALVQCGGKAAQSPQRKSDRRPRRPYDLRAGEIFHRYSSRGG